MTETRQLRATVICALVFGVFAVLPGGSISLLAVPFVWWACGWPEGRMATLLVFPLLGTGSEGVNVAELILLPITVISLWLRKSSSQERSVVPTGEQIVNTRLQWSLRIAAWLVCYTFTVGLLVSQSNGVGVISFGRAAVQYLYPLLVLFFGKSSLKASSRPIVKFLVLWYAVLSALLATLDWGQRRGFFRLTTASAYTSTGSLNLNTGLSKGTDGFLSLLVGITLPQPSNGLPMVLCIFGLATTLILGSRTLWFILGLTSVMALVAGPNRKRLAVALGLLGVAASAILSVGNASSAAAAVAARWRTLLGALNSGLNGDASFIQRRLAISETLAVWSSSPWVGVGPGHVYSWRIDTISRLRMNVTSAVQVDSPFTSLAALGLVGFALINALIVGMVIALLKSSGKQARLLSIIYGITVIVGLVSTSPIANKSFASNFLAYFAFSTVVVEGSPIRARQHPAATRTR